MRKANASRGLQGHAPPGKLFGVLLSLSRVSSHSHRILAGAIFSSDTESQIGGLFHLSVSTWTAFLYFKCIILKFNIKNLTDFCKMVETGVDLRLSGGDKKFNTQNSQAVNTKCSATLTHKYTQP